MAIHKDKSDKKREALVFISFIDLLVVAIFILLTWASIELVPITNNIRSILEVFDNDLEGQKAKKQLLENLKGLKPDALKSIANLNKEQLEKLDQLLSNLSYDRYAKLDSLLEKSRGGLSAIPYPEESEPIATLTIIKGTSQNIDEIKFKWSNFKPRFKSILEKYNRYPEVEVTAEYSYDDYVEIFETIFNNEFNEDKKKLNGLYRHKIRVIVLDEDGVQVSTKNIDKARVFRILNSFYLGK